MLRPLVLVKMQRGAESPKRVAKLVASVPRYESIARKLIVYVADAVTSCTVYTGGSCVEGSAEDGRDGSRRGEECSGGHTANIQPILHAREASEASEGREQQ